jgi:hypothetical protein
VFGKHRTNQKKTPKKQQQTTNNKKPEEKKSGHPVGIEPTTLRSEVLRAIHCAMGAVRWFLSNRFCTCQSETLVVSKMDDVAVYDFDFVHNICI